MMDGEMCGGRGGLAQNSLKQVMKRKMRLLLNRNRKVEKLEDQERLPNMEERKEYIQNIF